MLKQALLYKRLINIEYQRIKFDDKYKFLFAHSYRNKEFDIMEGKTDWAGIELTSVNLEGEVVGYLMATIDFDWQICTGLRILNFKNKGNLTFAKDLYQFLEELFTVHKVRKIQFQCIVGNPIEKMYLRYIKKYNGNVVGIFKNSILLSDGLIYDYTLYEIFKEDYDRITRDKRVEKII